MIKTQKGGSFMTDRSAGIIVNIEKLRALLEEMIRIPSINPDLDSSSPGEQKLSIYLAEYLDKAGFEVTVQEASQTRKNVIARLKGLGTGKTLMLNGHMDTVDVEGMTSDPFNPRFSNGKIYGRGSLDMKSGVAAMIIAAESIKEAGIELDGDLLLACVVDEEYKSIGTEALVKEYSADGAIVCEPTDMGIGIAHKGFAWERILVKGKAAHGSKPDEGIDAIMKAAKLLAAIHEMEEKKLRSNNHPLLGHPSIHASLITGGTGISTYPDKCVVQLERRTVPGESQDDVQMEMEGLLKDLTREDADFNAELSLYFYRSPMETAKESELVKTLSTTFEKHMGEKPPIEGFSGWADTAIISSAGIPAVLFGPAGKGLHAAEEYVDLQSVTDSARILAETAIAFCSN